MVTRCHAVFGWGFACLNAVAEGIKSLKDCSLCLAHVFNLSTLLDLGGFEVCHNCMLVLNCFAKGLQVIGLLGNSFIMFAEGCGDVLYR